MNLGIFECEIPVHLGEPQKVTGEGLLKGGWTSFYVLPKEETKIPSLIPGNPDIILQVAELHPSVGHTAYRFYTRHRLGLCRVPQSDR